MNFTECKDLTYFRFWINKGDGREDQDLYSDSDIFLLKKDPLFLGHRNILNQNYNFDSDLFLLIRKFAFFRGKVFRIKEKL